MEKHETLAQQRDQFVGFAFAAADVLLKLDRTFTITYASGAVREILNAAPGDLLEKSFLDILSTGDRSFFKAIMLGMRPGYRLNPKPIAVLKRKGGEARVLMSGFQMEGRSEIIYLTLSDLRRMPVHPHNDENFDRTTGMMKKDTFIEQARQHIESGEAVDGEKLTMLVIEGLEKLKAQKGQEAVDDFLRRLSERLRARSLAGDTVGLLGDGKIGVLHDSDVTEEIIRTEADSLSKEIAGETGADISVGGYSLDLSIENISKDDAAKSVAYALRQFSRGNHALTSVNVHQSATELLKSTSARLKDMAKTPLARSFKLALQPVVNLETRVIDHYEALTRFEGYQTPAQMISYSDRKDVLEDFDLLMIQRTLELLVKIEKEDKWQPTISVNISAKSLDSDIFVKQIGMLLMQQGLLQNSVAFEIGDVDEATDIPRLNRVIQRLRMNENQVYLDRMDIGNRYMQLAQNLQIDGIKISGPNVHKNLSSAEGKEQFKAFCKLCKRHKISVVAEAIEAEQDSIDLVSIGVEMGQGDLFGLPMINVKQRTFADTTNNKSSGSARNW